MSKPADTTQPRVVAPQLTEESWRYLVCETCGQAYDRISWNQVMYHSQPEHEPIRLHS
jgi:hypothetical protein